MMKKNVQSVVIGFLLLWGSRCYVMELGDQLQQEFDIVLGTNIVAEPVQGQYTHVAVFAYADNPVMQCPYVLECFDERSNQHGHLYGGWSIFVGKGNCLADALQMFNDGTQDAYKQCLSNKDFAWSINLTGCLADSRDGMRLFFVKLPWMVDVAFLCERKALAQQIVDYRWIPVRDFFKGDQRGLRRMLNQEEVRQALKMIGRGIQLQQSVADCCFEEDQCYEAKNDFEFNQCMTTIRERYGICEFVVIPYVCLQAGLRCAIFKYDRVPGRLHYFYGTCGFRSKIVNKIKDLLYQWGGDLMSDWKRSGRYTLFVFSVLKTVVVFEPLELRKVSVPGCYSEFAVVPFASLCISDRCPFTIPGSLGAYELHPFLYSLLHTRVVYDFLYANSGNDT